MLTTLIINLCFLKLNPTILPKKSFQSKVTESVWPSTKISTSDFTASFKVRALLHFLRMKIRQRRNSWLNKNEKLLPSFGVKRARGLEL
jgi:hypothetical protein